MSIKAIAVTPWLSRREGQHGYEAWAKRGGKADWFWVHCLAKRFPKTRTAERIRFRVYAEKPESGGGRWFWIWYRGTDSTTTKRGRWHDRLLSPVTKFIRGRRRLAALVRDDEPRRLYVVCEMPKCRN